METGNTRYHLSTLVAVSFVAGVLMFLNFGKNAVWHLDHGPVGMDLPSRPAPHHPHSHPAKGRGWPFLVTGTSLPDPGEEQVAWSWMGLCANLVFSSCLLLLLTVALEKVSAIRQREAVPKTGPSE